MSDPSHNNRIAVAGKRRRAYLLSKAAAVTMGIVGFGLLLCFGFLTLLSVLVMIMKLAGLKDLGAEPVSAELISGIVCAGIAYLGGTMVAKANNRVVDTPVVSPVREQIAALPAEEILVRGANEPVAEPGELLRAARAGEGTQVAELLRAPGTQDEGRS